MEIGTGQFWDMDKLLKFIHDWIEEHGFPQSEEDLAKLIIAANEPA